MPGARPTTPARRAWCVALLAPLAGSAAAAQPIRLLERSAPATLGIETRIASGAAGESLIDERYASREALPARAALPHRLARRQRVVVEVTGWKSERSARPGPLAPRRRRAVARVERGKGGASVALPSLAELAPGTPVRLSVRAFALPDDGVRRLRREVALPAQPLLHFGYGLRQESWGIADAPARFRVVLSDAEGARHTLFERVLEASKPEHQQWFDQRIDLAAFAGQSVRLAFRTDSARALPVWSDPRIVSGAAEPARPNVLIVSIDTLRARSVGSYGYARETSPFLDSIARAGTVFEEAIAPAVTTGPSHMSLFTGLYPPHHGMRWGDERRRATAPMLAQALRAAGYETAAFTEDGWLLRDRGFGDGFARYTENRGELGEVRLTFDQAARWLRAAPLRPFFLFVHTYEVHSPYAPAEPYRSLFAGDGRPGPDDPALRKARDDYDREIRVVDDALRGLFVALEQAGLARSTLVVVLSDHGEEFGEHGGTQHGEAVFEEALRVPLVFWAPDRIAPQRRAEPVSLIDVTPTVLDWVGLPVPDRFDGRSLAPALRGAPPAAARALYAEAFPQGRRSDVKGALVAIRTPGEKLIVHRPPAPPARPTLRFDLAADPSERRPLPLEPEREAAARERADAYLRGREDDAPLPPPAPAPDVSPDTRQRLRDLGYLD